MPRRTCANAARNWAPTRCSTSPMKSKRYWNTASNCARRRGPMTERRSSVDQLVFQGVVSQIAVGRQAHFLHEPGAVGTDGLDAQRKRLGDVAGGFAFRELEEHLEFALRKLLVGRSPFLAIELLR